MVDLKVKSSEVTGYIKLYLLEKDPLSMKCCLTEKKYEGLHKNILWFYLKLLKVKKIYGRITYTETITFGNLCQTMKLFEKLIDGIYSELQYLFEINYHLIDYLKE